MSSVNATPEVLIDQLSRAGDDLLHVTAVLWTWLDDNRQSFGSLLSKAPEIRRRALVMPEVTNAASEDLEALREAPLERAALMLARVDRTLRGRSAWPPQQTTGYDGDAVLVLPRRPGYVDAMSALLKRAKPSSTGESRPPPGADEHPSPVALAPSVDVCPVELDRIRLKLDRGAAGDEWRVAHQQMRVARFASQAMVVHLAPLGDDMIRESRETRVEGTDGPAGVAWFDTALTPCTAGAEEARAALVDRTEEATSLALREAIERAQGQAQILLMPELALSPQRLAELQSALRACDDAPALTAVGLHHALATQSLSAPDPDPALVGTSALGRRVNDAVLLGPNGVELLRHRKLTSAEFEGYVEDIRLGTTLTIALTPVGTLALATCLDVFAEPLEARFARCGAELLLVPSLSPSVHRHRNALQDRVQKLNGIAFVCNRWLPDPDAATPGSTWNANCNRSFCVASRCDAGPFPAAPDATVPLFVVPPTA